MIPILSDILKIGGGIIDKIWPDANTKEQAKTQFNTLLIEQAMTEQKLLFQDTEGAREMYKAELAAANVPAWARAIQVLGRPFTLYATVIMYIYSKVSIHLGLPLIVLSDMDYYLIGSVFVSLFGARTIEKMKGKQ